MVNKINAALIILVLFSCHRFEKSIDNDYEVLSKFLNILIADTKDFPIDSLYICDSTITNSKFSKYIKSNPFIDVNISEDAFNDFIAVNKSVYKFKKKFSFDVPYRLIKNSEVKVFTESFFDSTLINNWVRAGGVKYFSRVGFNKDRTEALFYYSGYAGPLSAVGLIISMEKNDTNWSIKNTMVLWIS